MVKAANQQRRKQNQLGWHACRILRSATKRAKNRKIEVSVDAGCKQVVNRLKHVER